MRSIGEFFSDLTDFDNKLLKTVVDLFRRPSQVVEAYILGQTTYIKPLRYALMTSSFYITAIFFYELLFGKDDKVADWLVPVRVAEFEERLVNFMDSFFPFLTLLTLVPPAILLTRLLFNKPWRETEAAVLYAFSQLWVLLIVMVPIPEFEMKALLQPLLSVSIIFVCFKKLVTGNLVLAGGKWLITAIILILWNYEIASQIVNFTFTKLTIKGERTRLIKADIVAAKVLPVDIPEKSRWNFAQNDPDNTALIMNKESEATGIKFRSPENNVLYDLQLEGSVRKVTKISPILGRSGWLIFHDLPEKDNVRELRATLISSNGRILYTKRYREKGMAVLNSGAVVNGKTLLLAGGKSKDGEIAPFIDALEFSLVNDKFDIIRETNYTLPQIRQRFRDLYILENTPESITLIVSKYESSAAGIGQISPIEITKFSIAKVTIDSTIHEDWEKVIFQKTTKYSPNINNFYMKADTIQDKIMASYSLANKEVIISNFYYLATNGTLLWEKEFTEDDCTFIYDFYSDSTGVYFCGHTVSIIPKHPIVNFYGLGMLGYASLDGKTVRKLFYGNFRKMSYQYFNKLIVKSDSIKVFARSTSADILGQRTKWEILTFKNDFLR